MKRSTRLNLQALDAKALPAGGPTTPLGISLNSFGVLNIKGDSHQDIATVTIDHGQVRAVLKHKFNGPIEGTPDWEQVFQDKSFDPAAVKSISFFGAGGGDSFVNETTIDSVALGGSGHDTLTGGFGNDRLAGGNDADTLEGRDGDDTLLGGHGTDEYLFKPNFSLVTVHPLGSDTIIESADAKTDWLDFSALSGGIELDLNKTSLQVLRPAYLSLTLQNPSRIGNVVGTSGDDRIVGNARHNRLAGAAGDDTLLGGAGNDTLGGGEGEDYLYGDAGNDNLDGGFDADLLRGGVGNDLLNGMGGNDVLKGEGGNDQAFGGAGNDTIEGGAGNDTLGGSFDNDQLDGGAGNDSLQGGDGNDLLLGGIGFDTLTGQQGNDSLYGGAGRDVLTGAEGNDLLDGEAGRDTMSGGAGGYDRLFASQANETLSGAERVEIDVPTDQPQTDAWSCGPNSGSRLLRAYGLNVSYTQLRADAQDSNIISDYGLGTPPPSLRNIMRKYRSSTQLKSGADFQDVLARLGEGRPVVALIGWGEIPIPAPMPWNPLNFDIAPEVLHYICLTGFDAAEQKVFYTDTNGVEKEMSFIEFKGKWNWPATGAVYGVLSALGVKKQTILW